MTYSSFFSNDRTVGGAAGGAKNAPAAAAAALGSPTLFVEDALNFLQMVKEAFKEHPDKYHLFMRLMNDFKNDRVSVAEVVSTAKALFQDNPELALRFNAFLPKGYSIQVGIDELATCFIGYMNLDDDGSGGH